MLTQVQINLLKAISPGTTLPNSRLAYENRSKLTALLGNDVFTRIHGKTVIDFGCGEGNDAIEMALNGATRVVGLDIREDLLEVARNRAAFAGVQEKCIFSSTTEERADVIISLDAFEHFSDPAAILKTMDDLLAPGGEVLISFGPTWYHPKGGHLFSVFPWAHLLFSEKALIGWRSTFKDDGATCFSEVAGGLNQMTIAKFQELVPQSPLNMASIELVPISKLRPLHNRLTREYTTSIVRCRLVK